MNRLRMFALLVWLGPATGAAEVPVLVGAGDIGACTSHGDEATAALLDDIAGTVFTVGDNAYPNGSQIDFSNCYAPAWGGHKARTRPAPGNHDYRTPNAAGYFAYFGARAGPADRGYYSYTLGGWHIIVVNSMLERIDAAAQEAWLEDELGSKNARCTLAYWHHPRFSSSRHGSQPQMQPIWEILYAHRAEVVVSAHDHVYERFAPQTPDGRSDPEHGIRQFVAGTGGRSLYAFGPALPNSEVRYNDGFGVLKLTLEPQAYTWEFLAVDGSTVDSGRGECR